MKPSKSRSARTQLAIRTGRGRTRPPIATTTDSVRSRAAQSAWTRPERLSAVSGDDSRRHHQGGARSSRAHGASRRARTVRLHERAHHRRGQRSLLRPRPLRRRLTEGFVARVLLLCPHAESRGLAQALMAKASPRSPYSTRGSAIGERANTEPRPVSSLAVC